MTVTGANQMFSSLLRLIAIRPLLSFAVLGIPVLILIAVGLVTIVALKVLVFIVLPIALILWVLRRVFGKSSGH